MWDIEGTHLARVRVHGQLRQAALLGNVLASQAMEDSGPE